MAKSQLVGFQGQNAGDAQKSNSREAEKQFFSDPSVQKTVTELQQIFDACYQCQAVTSGKLSVQETLLYSRQYLEVLKGAAVDRDTPEGYRDCIAWSLFESLFFNQSDSLLTFDLIRWAATSFPDDQILMAKMEDEVKRTGKQVEEASDYWRTTVFQLLSFHFVECAHLLQDSGQQDQATEAFITALHRMNLEWLLQQDSMSAYISWQKSLGGQVASGIFDQNPNIKFLAGMLTGDKKVYSRLVEAIVPNWWQLVPLYTTTWYPAAEITQLPDIAEECRRLYPATGDQGDLFASILSLDHFSVLQEMIHPPYLAVHLADLIHASMSGAKEDENGTTTIYDLRNYLIKDYGKMLMTSSSIWTTGVNYLCTLGVEGRAEAEQHLLTIPIKGENTANQIYRIAKEQRMDRAAQHVADTMVKKYLKTKCWGPAVAWALRGDDEDRNALDAVCHTVLQEASCEEVAQLYALENLGDRVLQSSGLTFLYSYFQFSKSLTDGLVHESLALLITLFKGSTVPHRFSERLLEHLMDILGSVNEIPIEKEVLYELMSVVNQLSTERLAEMPEDEARKMDNTAEFRMLRTLLSQAFVKTIAVDIGPAMES
ncbi:unnamed protein product, partial [Mesorhabditis spiculigera]